MMTKKICVILAAAAVAVVMCFSGCGSQAGSGTSVVSSAPKISKDDIKWSVRSGSEDGYPRVVFTFQNNTKYDITSFNVDFKVKKGVTAKQLNQFGTLKEKAKTQEEKITDMTFEAGTTDYVEAGGKSKEQECGLDGTIQCFTEFDAYDLFEPDKMTVSYIAHNRIYTAYYDYANKEMSYDDDSKKAFSWSDCKMAKLLPRPKAKLVTVSLEGDGEFSADIYAADEETFENYLKACKEKGFTKDMISAYDTYSADDKNGNSLSLAFDSDNDDIAINVLAK